jgi:hypothetical protein
MSDVAIEPPAAVRAPWHLWVVGILSLLWNASGTYVIMAAQNGAVMDMDAHEVAYYAAQEPWVAIVADIALVAALFGAVTLFLRSRRAVLLYSISVAAIVVSAGYEAAGGTALFLTSDGWLIQFCVTTCLAIAQLVYAIAMKTRGVLR